MFGPVRSRRLGISLGVNNIPYKFCSYSCIYCQLGRTINKTIKRRAFYKPEDIINSVIDAVKRLRKIDYISFVPDGEPTLDKNLKSEIDGMKKALDIPIAVFTNASLLWIDEVREALYQADLVSIKVDAVSDSIWKAINRPHLKLEIGRILESIREFVKSYRGKVISETMLVSGINTVRESLREISRYLKDLNVDVAYISVPIRPPAERWVRPPSYFELIQAYETFKDSLGENKVKLLNMPEDYVTHLAGEPEEYILRTTAVHPLRYEHAVRLISEHDKDPNEVIDKLIKRGLIEIVDYLGTKFIIRRFLPKNNNMTKKNKKS